MKTETILKDVEKLEKALKLIEKTESYFLFKKSNLIFEICEQITTLKEKAEKQNIFINSTNQPIFNQ